MEPPFSLDAVLPIVSDISDWAWANLFVPATAYQAGLIVAAFIAAHYISIPIRKQLKAYINARPARDARPFVYQLIDEIDDLVLPIIWALLQWAIEYGFLLLELPNALITLTTRLITAWIVIRLATSFLRSSFWSRVVAITVWIIAALSLVGWLDYTRDFLDGLSVELGEIRVSALSVFNGLISLAILLWIATLVTRLIDQQVDQSRSLTPSIKVLVRKITRIVAIGLAVVLALGGAGIDLTALTIFSGALGIGIGFGLQKIVANFISGIILLLDKSVKPGDNIVVGDTFGWIDKLNARYVSVITRDGTEHLIPNEDLITLPVENWSYTNRLLRLRIPVGISYGSDVRRAMELCEEAANETDRIVDQPAPRCHLIGFGDSAVDLEIRVWIEDPQNGRGPVVTECLLGVWDKFHENGIEFPFPQRDVHVKIDDDQVQGLASALKS